MTPLEQRHVRDAEEFLLCRSRREPLVVHARPWRQIDGCFDAAEISDAPVRVLVDLRDRASGGAASFYVGAEQGPCAFVVIRPAEGRMELLRQWRRCVEAALAHAGRSPRHRALVVEDVVAWT